MLVLPSGLRLLRVVTEWFVSLRSRRRAACGGASPIGAMLIYVLCGDEACGGGPHELCAVCDGCIELYAMGDWCMGEPCIQAGATTVAHSMPLALVVVFFTSIDRFVDATLPPGIVAGRFMSAARPPGAMSTVHLASFAATRLDMAAKNECNDGDEDQRDSNKLESFCCESRWNCDGKPTMAATTTGTTTISATATSSGGGCSVGDQYGMLCMYESGAYVAAATSSGGGCSVGDQYGMLCMYESCAYVE